MLKRIEDENSGIVYFIETEPFVVDGIGYKPPYDRYGCETLEADRVIVRPMFSVVPDHEDGYMPEICEARWGRESWPSMSC